MITTMINRYKKKRGAILVLFAFGLIALFGFVSLGTDLGIIYKRRAELQQAVDAAALAGSKKVDELKNLSLMSDSGLYWGESQSYEAKWAAIQGGAKNGVGLVESDITLLPGEFPEKVYVRKEQLIELFFAKMVNVKSVTVVVESTAENQFLSSGMYDIVPWGIPKGLAVQNANVELQSDDHFSGFAVSNLGTLNFVPGREYLLKLGSGIPDSAYDASHAGDKLIIPMGSGDQPNDAAFKKAYGFVYWCLQHDFPVDWLMNFRGGSFVIDYRGDLFNGSFPDVTFSNSSGPGTLSGTFSGLAYELIPKEQVGMTYKSAHKTLYMEKDLSIAVYTVVPKWTSDIIPLGIDYRQPLNDDESYVLKFNTWERKIDPVFMYFDETIWRPGSQTINELSYEVDFNGDDQIDDYAVRIDKITVFSLEVGQPVVFDEKIWLEAGHLLDETIYDVDLTNDGFKTLVVQVQNVLPIALLETKAIVGPDWDETDEVGKNVDISEADYGIDLNGNGNMTDTLIYPDITTRRVQPDAQDNKALVDMSNDGDFNDLFITTRTIYRVDINANGVWVDVVGLDELTYRVDADKDELFINPAVEFIVDGAYLPGPGNFAGLAIDGNGANVYSDGIMFGCETELSIGDVLDSEPGNMAGPTDDAISYRLDNGLIYVTCPIVDTLDVNGRKEVVIVGFAHFILEATAIDDPGDGNNAKAVITGTYVDVDEWVNNAEDPNAFVVARTLTEAGVPFTWVHDEEILNGDLANFHILMTDDDRKFVPDVAGKISEFVNAGGYLYAQDGPTVEIDTKIEIFNNLNSAALPQIAFLEEKLDIDPAVATVNSNLAEDFQLNSNYAAMSDFELMAVQNHSSTITGYTGEVSSFDSSAVKASIKELGAIDANNYKYLFTEYGQGHAVLLGGHDQETTAGWRLILNNIFIASQQPDNLAMKPNLGCLDLNGIENAIDEQEYEMNLTTGFEGAINTDTFVYSLPGNIFGITNAGVSLRYNADTGAIVDLLAGDVNPSGSPRGIVVPIIIPSPFSSEDYFADNTGRTVIYDLKGRSRVKVIGLGLFLLSDINQNAVASPELSINPDDTTGKGTYNGQVRGLFVKYLEVPGGAGI